MSKHISSKEMKIIESNLDNNTPLKDIAISVQKDPRAVSRHIKSIEFSSSIVGLKIHVQNKLRAK